MIKMLIGTTNYPDNISLNVVRDLTKFHNIKTLLLNELESNYFKLLMSPNEIIKEKYLNIESICLNSGLITETKLNLIKSKYKK